MFEMHAFAIQTVYDVCDTALGTLMLLKARRLRGLWQLTARSGDQPSAATICAHATPQHQTYVLSPSETLRPTCSCRSSSYDDDLEIKHRCKMKCSEVVSRRLRLLKGISAVRSRTGTSSRYHHQHSECRGMSCAFERCVRQRW